MTEALGKRILVLALSKGSNPFAWIYRRLVAGPGNRNLYSKQAKLQTQSWTSCRKTHEYMYTLQQLNIVVYNCKDSVSYITQFGSVVLINKAEHIEALISETINIHKYEMCYDLMLHLG